MVPAHASILVAAPIAVLFLFACGGDGPSAPKDAALGSGPDVQSTPRDGAPDRPQATDARVDVSADAPVDSFVDASVEASVDVGLPDTGDGGSDVRPGCGPFAGGNAGGAGDALASPSSRMSFFVSSLVSATGNLGGLAGADSRCQTLAAAVGVPSANWRAYLSVEHDPAVTGAPVNARDRIGKGPWFNAYGLPVATDVTALHVRGGDPTVFVDERGRMINGQWTSSPTPNEHDILTGSNPDGTVAMGKTCADWTSALGPTDGGTGGVARVGHSDGIGPQCSVATAPTNYTSWNSTHDNAGCDNTAPRGGAGRIYCFLAN